MRTKAKVHQTVAAAQLIPLTEVRESLPGAIVTLTITGTAEAVQRAFWTNFKTKLASSTFNADDSTPLSKAEAIGRGAVTAFTFEAIPEP